MVTKFDYTAQGRDRRLADLQDQTAELERQLADARVALERELGETAWHPTGPAGEAEGDRPVEPEWDGPPATRAGQGGSAAAGRTERLVSAGRSNAYSPGRFRGRKRAATAAVGVALLIMLVVVLSGGGPSWPASVPAMQAEAAKACQNPDVRSEPNQVNFACAKATAQILWVFALLTSGGDAHFADARTGRMGLEPITPRQGGEVAWSLNLHDPYVATNPVDSIEVAARAINNIIGGATLTGANGKPVVQPGLESSHADCLRYTGSAALRSRPGYPSLCAKPVTTPAGQAALVADVYQKWVVGSSPQAAQDAAVLFENASNPGDPRVQSILKHLPSLKPGRS